MTTVDPRVVLVATLLADPRRSAGAACYGAELDVFFPTRGEDTEPAKAICRTCPVIDDCLEFALASVERIGIWGGTAERERRSIRHLRKCDRVGCDNKAHVEIVDPAPDWVAPEYAGLWRRHRAPRRATFGNGSRSSRAIARVLAS